MGSFQLFGQYKGTASVTQGRATKTISGLYSCTGGRITDVGVINSQDGIQWTVPAEVRYNDTLFPFSSDLHNSCTGALYNNTSVALAKLADGKDIVAIDDDGEVITGFVFADNYFEMYINGIAVGKDKVPFTQFNSSIVRFKVKRPFTIAILLVDWEENLGLGSEANGGFAYHPGDGGMVAIFKDNAGEILAITDRRWRAQTFYTAPVTDLSCPTEQGNLRLSSACSTQNTNNGSNYYALHWPKPASWFMPDFDDSGWPFAYEYSNETVGVNNKAAYTNFPDLFDNPNQNAAFIWTSNIVLDNEVVVRYTVEGPSSTTHKEAEPFIRLVPNPGNQLLTLVSEKSLEDTILGWDIFSLDGQRQLSPASGVWSADASTLSAGSYLIYIYTEHKTIVKVWIKE